MVYDFMWIEKVKFLLYYAALRLAVFFGFRRTLNPVDYQWRWKYWKNRKRFRHVYPHI